MFYCDFLFTFRFLLKSNFTLKVNLILPIICLLIAVSGFAEDSQNDYHTAFNSFNALYGQRDLSPALSPALRALETAKREKNNYYLVKSHLLVAYIYSHINDYGQGIIHYLEGARYAELIEDPKLIKDKLSIHKNLSGILDDYHHYDLAHRFNNNALQIAIQSDNKKEILSLLGINRVHFFMAEKRYQDALVLIDSVFNHFELNEKMHIILNNKKGACLVRLDQQEKAKKTFLAAIKFDPKHTAKEYTYALNNLSLIYKDEEKYDSALYFLSKTKNSIALMGSKINSLEFTIARTKASVYQAMNDIENTLLHFDTALSYVGKPDIGTNYFEIFKDVSEFYESQNDIAKALAYKSRYSEHLNKYLDQKNKIEELDKKYNIELLTDRYFDLLAAQNDKKEAVRTAQWSMGSVIMLLLFALIFMIQQKIKINREIRRSLLQIELESDV